MMARLANVHVTPTIIGPRPRSSGLMGTGAGAMATESNAFQSRYSKGTKGTKSAFEL